jgi:hypothetical protein
VVVAAALVLDSASGRFIMRLLRWAVPLGIALIVALAAPRMQGRGDAAKDAGGNGSSPIADDAFWKIWGDGQGEVSSYDLTFPRYGELRKGTAVLIFVTETFSNEARVKADPGRHSKSDEFPVMKLNLIQDFATGIYDYHLMTSTYVALAPVNGHPAGSPTKIAFGAQDWCSHAYQQLLFDAKGIRYTGHSYFDGEGDQERILDRKSDGFAEDALFLWARGFAEPRLSAGESKTVPFLISCETSRLQHRPMQWTTATLSRSKESRQVEVPGGPFEVETYTVKIDGDGDTWTIDVENASRRRIVRWETSAGERGELLAAERMKYWEMNGETFTEEVKKLRLTPRPPRTM